MICGVGVDIVQVDRFEHWTSYSMHQLQKIFNLQEIDACRGENGTLQAEKLAVRFAAKEAFYKAFSATLVNLNLNTKEFSFMLVCPYIVVVDGPWGVPQLNINWSAFETTCSAQLPPLHTHLSLSHEKTAAVAFVIIEGS